MWWAMGSLRGAAAPVKESGGPASEAAVGAGGVPVLSGKLCIGGIGVSGALPEIDDRIAAAGASTVA